jgi:hypothetical protein
MAVLNLTPDEFADIALLFLADKAVNPEKVSEGNEQFNTFMKRTSHCIKNPLVKYYLDVDPEQRKNYKLIKKIFQRSKNAGQLSVIRIGPDKVIKGVRTEKKKAKSLLKTIVKKLIGRKKKNEDLNINQEEMKLILEYLEEE